MEKEKSYTVEYTKIVKVEKIFSEEEVQKAAERIKKERIMEAFDMAWEKHIKKEFPDFPEFLKF